MNLLEAMEQRHAIRAYTDEPVDQAVLDILRAEIDALQSGERPAHPDGRRTR